MTVTRDQYRQALDVIHEYLPHQLQRQDSVTGEWQNIGTSVRGQATAFERLNALQKSEPEVHLRVLPKNEADKYREGVLAGRAVANKKTDTKGMYMPEHL